MSPTKEVIVRVKATKIPPPPILYLQMLTSPLGDICGGIRDICGVNNIHEILNIHTKKNSSTLN